MLRVAGYGFRILVTRNPKQINQSVSNSNLPAMADKQPFMSPKIAIVILNWNGAKLLQQFLPSIISFSNNDSTQIIVADNGSTDSSPELIRNEFPEVRLLSLTQNL